MDGHFKVDWSSTIERYFHPLFIQEASNIFRYRNKPDKISSTNTNTNKSSSILGTERSAIKDAFVLPGVELDDTMSSRAIKTETSLSSFLAQLMNSPEERRDVWRDVRKNTPQLMLLGGVSSMLFLLAMIGYTFKYLWIYLSWGDIYKIFTDATQTLSDYIDSVYTLDDAIAVRSEE